MELLRDSKKKIATLLATLFLGGGGVAVGDAQINPYNDKGTHHELPLVAEIHQGERVEINKEKAQMDLVFWNDEERIRITPLVEGGELPDPAQRALLSKRMEFGRGPIVPFIEPKDGTTNEFDIDFELKRKPDTNVFEYAIQGAEDFHFWYQGELTDAEAIEYLDIINSRPNEEGVVLPMTIEEAKRAMRPENVVGSYAVYHKTKAHYQVGETNYASGKAFHIYRPKAIDKNGVEVWAVLDYKDGILSVTVPQDFLDNAKYPVIVDPTFGYTTAGGSLRTGGANDIFASPFTSPSDVDTVQSLTASQSDTFGEDYFKGVIVLDSSLNIVTNGITAEGTINAVPQAWYSSDFGTDPTLTGSTVYLLGVIHFYDMSVWYDTGASGVGCVDTTNSYSSPANLGTCTDNTQKYSIYVTYTAAAAGGGEAQIFQDVIFFQ